MVKVEYYNTSIGEITIACEIHNLKFVCVDNIQFIAYNYCYCEEYAK